MKTLKALALVAIMALPAAGQQGTDNTFRWNGKVPAGRWIRVVNLNGAITVGAASGDNVEVTATKRWKRGDPTVVHFSSTATNDGQLVCALWGDGASCDDRGYHMRGGRDRQSRNNDVSVEFQVLVPKGVRVAVETVNGAVTVDGATSEVHAEAVNGDVDVATTGGRVNAETVNGNVRARLGRIDNDGDMKFETVNGSVIVEFNGEFGGDVDMETVNGSLNTNFEMTVSGRLDPKHLRAHIGKPGGPRIKLETVNGSVELRRR
jgi:hypothetical protein